MSDHLAMLLPPPLVAEAKKLGALIRAQRVAPLVGAGLSTACGLPKWQQLVDRLILARREWDVPLRDVLTQADYIRFVRRNFRTDAAVISYLRRIIDQEQKPEGETKSFGQLLYSALYSGDSGESILLDLKPLPIHKHIVCAFADAPARIWTTNYDDIIETAAELCGIQSGSLDPHHRRPESHFSIAHLHGYLPKEVRRRGGELQGDPGNTQVVLAEDDYHAISNDFVGWTNRELFRLFDEYTVLMLGMSLDDPNVRRVLSVLGESHRTTGQSHFAMMKTITEVPKQLSSNGSSYVDEYIRAANEARKWYWSQHGVNIIEISEYEYMLPFLVRLRFESFGEKAGALWQMGADRIHKAHDPWDLDLQRRNRLALEGARYEFCKQFSVPEDEVFEIGIFLLQSDARSLELVYRGGREKSSARGGRVFSADPDAPTGVAGRVFVSGDLVRIPVSHELHNFGLDDAVEVQDCDYAGIISVPIVDWSQRGVPLGVAYITTTTVDGTLFKMPSAGAGNQTLHDVYEYLERLALSVVRLP